MITTQDQEISRLDFNSQRYHKYVLTPWAKQKEAQPLKVTNSQGVYLELANNQRVLDMKSQAFCANLGHNHPGMIEALTTAAKKARVVSADIMCPTRLKLAQDLLAIAPKNKTHKLSKTFFTLGGAEANENAIKMARLVTNKHKIITRYRSYHGATLATINFSGDYRRLPFDGHMTGVVRFPDHYPRGSGQNIDTVRLLEEIIEIEGPDTIAAILLEGITGANGVFIPPKNYWPRIREICDKNNIILIADEVLSGFCRTGTWFGVDNFNTCPDIMTLSKGLTAGYAPLGAVLVNNKIADFFESNTLWCGLTNYGHSLCCAAARAAIKIYQQENILVNVKKREQELKKLLDNLQKSNSLIAESRSIGLLAAIDLQKSAQDSEPLVPYRATGEKLKPAKLLQKFLLEEGISTAVRFSTVLIAPPLIITQEELNSGMMGISRALKRLELALN